MFQNVTNGTRNTKRTKKARRGSTKVVKRKQRGGLFNNILYGGIYDPINDAIRKAIDRSAKRFVTSTLLTGLKSITAVSGIHEITKRIPIVKIITGLLLFSNMVANNKINALARTGIIKMLNKYAVYDKTKSPDFKGISYPHIWKDVDDENKTERIKGIVTALTSHDEDVDTEDRLKFIEALRVPSKEISTISWDNRNAWLNEHKLPTDLSFDVKKINTDVTESKEIKEEVATVIENLSDSEKTELDEKTKEIIPIVNNVLEIQGVESINNETQTPVEIMSKLDEAVDLEKTFETGALPQDIQEKITEHSNMGLTSSSAHDIHAEKNVGGKKTYKKRRVRKYVRM
uniref:Uncharacterized protein n=1 Tax=viral metagenome TaxID=1070528 RepID=A0A6C0DQY1_9ZZZZ